MNANIRNDCFFGGRSFLLYTGVYEVGNFLKKNSEEMCDDEFSASLRVPGEYELSTEELRFRVGRRGEYELGELRDGRDHGRAE